MAINIRTKFEIFQRFLSLKLLGKHRIKAVRDEDLQELLKSLHIQEEFNNGQLSCYICGAQIDIGNLQAIARSENKFQFICSKTSCISSVK